ncbi:hypothetical protein CRM94_26225 [Burkholderia gladioli]|uniref:Uncharacterized protein n=1 Tax=Burkholderia gladioli TaxID=28095 RepID=A0A2A7S2P2_BURGA|nr:hypothetical protein A8H28_28185 [Burkholderia gladioli pv. gladioli]PEH37944.1 hypothetical protein CRM94_26225 [Burkholderia gladioli]
MQHYDHRQLLITFSASTLGYLLQSNQVALFRAKRGMLNELTDLIHQQQYSVIPLSLCNGRHISSQLPRDRIQSETFVRPCLYVQSAPQRRCCLAMPSGKRVRHRSSQGSAYRGT